jgi:RimJ/RimL family protein N-acetyltransferase
MDVQETTEPKLDLPQAEIVVLRDGTPVAIRPIRTDDGPRLQALFGRLSPESIYLRFLGQPKELPDDQAQRLANLDYRTQMAFVGTLVEDGREEIVGVARYAQVPRMGSDAAEAGVVVEDRYQRLGLGTMLLQRLADYARSQGIRAFVASIHHSNTRILRFIRRSGLPVDRRIESGLWEIRVSLED